MILTDQLSPGQEGAGVPVVPPATSHQPPATSHQPPAQQREHKEWWRCCHQATLHTTRASNWTSQCPKKAPTRTLSLLKVPTSVFTIKSRIYLDKTLFKDNHFNLLSSHWHHTVCFIAMQTLDAALPIFSGTIQ